MTNLQKLRDHVCQQASNTNFIHHKWFVTHHLEIIELLVEDLLRKYPTADRTICHAMVWVHDWGKILTNKGPNEDEVSLAEIEDTLPKLGFTLEQVAKIKLTYLEMEHLKEGQGNVSLETKIISSADGLAHYIGPFFCIYWAEYAHRGIAQLIDDNQLKLSKDMRKIVLPEAKAVAEARMQSIAEFNPTNRPTHYIV